MTTVQFSGSCSWGLRNDPGESTAEPRLRASARRCAGDWVVSTGNRVTNRIAASARRLVREATCYATDSQRSSISFATKFGTVASMNNASP